MLLRTVLAIVMIVGAVLATVWYFFHTPVLPSESEPDWAVIWTMRWTALAAAFTGLSWIAILATAAYAHYAISVTGGIERTKLARELIREYHVRGIEEARKRCTGETVVEQYSQTDFLADLDTILLYLEECAIHEDARTVDARLLFRFLDVKIVATWRSIVQSAFPSLAKITGSSSGRFTRAYRFVLKAQADLRRRRDIAVAPALLEALPKP